MHALWFNRLRSYMQSPHHIPTVRRIIDLKIAGQHRLLKQHHITLPLPPASHHCTTTQIFLYEARFAKQYWDQTAILLPLWCDFKGRKPRRKDIVNTLLDIGYHHLATTVDTLCRTHEIPTEIGLLHTPHTNKSKPLVYDLMELFRADVVDAEMLRFLRSKKKEISFLDQKTIATFLHRINQRMEKQYYLKEFNSCRTHTIPN